MCGQLTQVNFDIAVTIKEVPAHIRGFRKVKLACVEEAVLGREAILGRLATSGQQERAA